MCHLFRYCGLRRGNGAWRAQCRQFASVLLRFRRVPVKERRALAWVNNALDRVAYPAIDSLTVRATKPVCATGWHSPQLSAPGHTRQRCTRLQADINQSLLVRTVEASLAAGISACRPQGEKGQVIQGHGLRPQVGLRTQSGTFSTTEARCAKARGFSARTTTFVENP